MDLLILELLNFTEIFVYVIGRMAVVFGINSSRIVNRKEIVLGFASHYFTPSCLQCSHY